MSPQRRIVVDRRAFLAGGLIAPFGAAAAALSGGEEGKPPAASPASLREKFFGCICGCHIGSAMAAPVEGWNWQRIEKEHGTLDRLLSYEHYGNGWKREPGTTEDGVERQKLMITAIIEKQDRVTAEDVRRIWVRDIKPESAGKVSEPFEATLLAMAKTPIPAADLGKYCDYSGLVTLSRSCHPLGLINAGDERSGVADVHEVGQLYQTANSRGIRWAAVTATAIAAAARPWATVESVLDAVRTHCDPGVVGEIERGLERSSGCRDFRELRQAFDKLYYGSGIPYAQSYANEVVTRAVAIFKMVKGNLWEAMVAGVNFGRDTDCTTAIAAGISGALTGAGSLPAGLVEQVDRATGLNPYTNSRRTLREHSDGLHEAFRARLKRMKEYSEAMGAA